MFANKTEAMPHIQRLIKAMETFVCGSVKPESVPFLAIITKTQDKGCMQEFTGVKNTPENT